MKLENHFEGVLQKRYKRFLADVTFEDGTETTAHCPNSGSMKTCAESGWRVCCTKSDNPKRKLKYTLEFVHNMKCWIGVNTHRTNHLVHEALKNDVIEELIGYTSITVEKKYGDKSRIDFFLQKEGEDCYVEVKSVSMVLDGIACFPDAKTLRGQKHLDELVKIKKEGDRAVLLLVIQRSDGDVFKPAREIDPVWAEKLKTAMAKGVEVYAYCTKIEPPLYELTSNKMEIEL